MNRTLMDMIGSGNASSVGDYTVLTFQKGSVVYPVGF